MLRDLVGFDAIDSATTKYMFKNSKYEEDSTYPYDTINNKQPQPLKQPQPTTTSSSSKEEDVAADDDVIKQPWGSRILSPSEANKYSDFDFTPSSTPYQKLMPHLKQTEATLNKKT